MKISTCTFVVCLWLNGLSQTNNYYFGNLHAHTAMSDGNKDSAASGVSKPDGSYAYAKLSDNFDFLGISEHNHYSNSKNPGFKIQNYQQGLAMANAANSDGTFCALFGMEYGVASENNGHVIIYGFNQLLGWETTVPGVTGNNYDIYNAKTDYDGLFRKIKNNPGAFCYLAHPNFDDYCITTYTSNALAYAPYNAAYDSAIVGVPLRSGVAFSTVNDYSEYSTWNYFNYYKKMLYLGYHLGIGYDHDNHYTNFGRSNAGRLVILAPSLTRPNLVAAMQKMHFYGSDDPNAKIDFRLGNHIMGSIVSGTTFPTFQLIHNDPDGELADTIRIWKGHKNSGGLWAQTEEMVKQNNAVTFTDYNVKQNIEYYYFAEIRQADGQWIVTSPIWYTSTVPLSLPESGHELTFHFFPNPVSGALSISFSRPGSYTIAVMDVTGRVVLEDAHIEKDAVISLSGIGQGVYTLRASSGNTSQSKKLVIE